MPGKVVPSILYTAEGEKSAEQTRRELQVPDPEPNVGLSAIAAATAEHYREVCRECGTTVSQCRCASPSKVTRYVTCDSCKAK